MGRTLIAAVVIAMMAGPAAAAMSSGTDDPPAASLGDVKRYVEREQYDRAIKKAEQFLASNPRSADAYNYIGYAHRKLGDFAAAAKAYDRALTIDANHVGVHEYYGELQIALGDMAKAEAHLAALTRICGDCAEREELAGHIAKAKTGG